MHRKEEAPHIKFPKDVVINIDNPSKASTFVNEGIGKDSTRKQYGTPIKYACDQENGILYKFFNSANIAISTSK
jgi:hypothetical protein